MNILIPHHWLLDHLETEATPDEIQEHLSLSGPSVERVIDQNGQKIYDIEVTTNRVDNMSVRGIAREAAVILQQAGIPANLKNFTLPEINAEPEKSLPLPKIINDPTICNRIACVIISNVRQTPTPKWMADRLLQIEQNVHHSLIDITNYITHELGYPCHAFDYDAIMNLGGTIIIKKAQKDQKFTTLDGEEYQCAGGEVVFENEVGEIIDLPAIKGTANTSISDSTQNILLWIEHLDPQLVRFASMTHAIRTVAAQLAEKQLDPNLATDVLKRGVELYQQLANGVVASQLYEEFPGQKQPSQINVPLNLVEHYLGLSLETTKITSILEALGCLITLDHNELVVTPPTFRPDLTIPADVIEEIARIYGYHNLPSKIMDTALPTTRPTDQNFTLEHKIKQFLSNIGWQEIYSYSLVGEQVAEASGYQIPEHLKLLNPLTDDKVFLRRSLLPSLEEIISQNSQVDDLSVFEMANVYHPQSSELPQENMTLALVSSQAYRKVKGDLEALFAKLFIKEHQLIVDDQPSPGFQQSAKIMIRSNQEGKSIELGVLGILPSKHVGIELSLKKLIAITRTHPQYQPLPKTPAVIEDVTFFLPEKTLIGQLIAEIKNSHFTVSDVKLISIYKQNASFRITYWDPQSTLDSRKMDSIRKAVINQIESIFEARLIGQV